jgi:ribosomal protein S18 acetylase RimI-like enzyme
MTGAPQEWWNVAFVTEPLDRPEETLAATARFFEERRQRFIVRIREGLDDASEQALASLGFAYTDSLAGMVLAPVPAAPAPPGDLDVRAVAGAGLDDLMTVLAESFEIAPEDVRKLMPARLLEREGWRSYVGYAGGQPAASASVLAMGGVAGITFVGTRPDFRRRGFGETVTWAAVAEGRRAGCAMAALQASPMGFPVYARMGFRTITRYKTYVLPQFIS